MPSQRRPSTGSRRPPSPPRRQAKPSHPFTDAARGERLQRIMADAGVGSRRQCEALIAQGEVTVNKVPVTELPAWVNPQTDRIVVSGKRIESRQRPIHVMLNKPRGVTTTNADPPPGLRRAIDLVQHPSHPRLFTVGPLDAESTGLVLLMNDGDLANKLTHARYGVPKTYELTVRGGLTADDLANLQAGAATYFHRARLERTGAGESTIELSLLKRDGERTKLLVHLAGGHADLRDLFLRLGHPIKKLRRVGLGPLRLKSVALGEWRELTAREVASLRKAKGRDRGKTKRRSP